MGTTDIGTGDAVMRSWHGTRRAREMVAWERVSVRPLSCVADCGGGLLSPVSLVYRRSRQSQQRSAPSSQRQDQKANLIGSRRIGDGWIRKAGRFGRHQPRGLERGIVDRDILGDATGRRGHSIPRAFRKSASRLSSPRMWSPSHAWRKPTSASAKLLPVVNRFARRRVSRLSNNSACAAL